MEDIAVQKSNLPEIPTWESIEKAKDLKNTKNNILDNIEKSMSTVGKIEKIQKKKWDSIKTNDADYGNKLQEYAKSKETIENINKNLRFLHEAVSNSWGIAKNYIGELKFMTKDRLNGTPTGYIENPISVKMTSILNKSSNNYLSDIDNIIEANLSEFVIDHIFKLSNSVPIYDLNIFSVLYIFI